MLTLARFTRRPWPACLALAACACIALGIGLRIQRGLCEERHALLNPNVRCATAPTKRSEWDYEPLRKALSDTVDQYEASGAVPRLALSFRDLQNGPRFGIRKAEPFTPASLLKLPVLMTILHLADRDPSLLDERITLKEHHVSDSLEAPPEELQINASYSVRQLLQRMIEYSDNDAAFLLLSLINASNLPKNSNALSDLGTLSLMTGGLDNVRVISLVNIFSVLYSAGYLSAASSQYALDLLSHTTFARGLVAGVPTNVSVAHKYGIYAVPGKPNELHDCGIVYHPRTPYVLCVLTSGGSLEREAEAIQHISRTVYESVDAMP